MMGYLGVSLFFSEVLETDGRSILLSVLDRILIVGDHRKEPTSLIVEAKPILLTYNFHGAGSLGGYLSRDAPQQKPLNHR